MATNEVFRPGDALSVVCTHPATPASSNPVRVGELGGVAQTAERADGTTSVLFDGVFELSVKGENNAGNSAVAVGDKLYYEDAATPVINKDNVAGHPFGIALAAVNAGATATIRVKLATF
jgi:predicted RecA/RadA family phage recombinase